MGGWAGRGEVGSDVVVREQKESRRSSCGSCGDLLSWLPLYSGEFAVLVSFLDWYVSPFEELPL